MAQLLPGISAWVYSVISLQAATNSSSRPGTTIYLHEVYSWLMKTSSWSDCKGAVPRTQSPCQVTGVALSVLSAEDRFDGTGQRCLGGANALATPASSTSREASALSPNEIVQWREASVLRLPCERARVARGGVGVVTAVQTNGAGSARAMRVELTLQHYGELVVRAVKSKMKPSVCD